MSDKCVNRSRSQNVLFAVTSWGWRHVERVVALKKFQGPQHDAAILDWHDGPVLGPATMTGSCMWISGAESKVE